MRIVIMGTGPFAVPSCRRIVELGHEVPLVIVRPRANAKAPQSPVEAWAQAQQLPIYQPASINDPAALEQLRSCGAELLFVCDYGQILSRDCLASARLGGINLHGSLLPRHRGAAPVQWTILSGDSQAGVSVIHMTPGLDAGPVIAVRSTPVGRDENAGELEARLSQIGSEATQEAIDKLANWDGQSVPGLLQDKSQATKAPRLSKQDGAIDVRLAALELERKVRGYQPWPGVYGELVYSDSKKISLHVRAARALAGSLSQAVGSVAFKSAAELGLPASEWSAPWDKLLLIQTGDGLLACSLVQPAGKRAMSVDEFMRGHPLTPAANLTLPQA